jgi:hypothetical protein
MCAQIEHVFKVKAQDICSHYYASESLRIQHFSYRHAVCDVPNQKHKTNEKTVVTITDDKDISQLQQQTERNNKYTQFIQYEGIQLQLETKRNRTCLLQLATNLSERSVCRRQFVSQADDAEGLDEKDSSQVKP